MSSAPGTQVAVLSVAVIEVAAAVVLLPVPTYSAQGAVSSVAVIAAAAAALLLVLAYTVVRGGCLVGRCHSSCSCRLTAGPRLYCGARGLSRRSLS